MSPILPALASGCQQAWNPVSQYHLSPYRDFPRYLHTLAILLQRKIQHYLFLHQVANEAGSKEYEEDYNEDSGAYGDYQGSEEYQYHYDGDDYPSYEGDYSEEQVGRENCAQKGIS